MKQIIQAGQKQIQIWNLEILNPEQKDLVSQERGIFDYSLSLEIGSLLTCASSVGFSECRIIPD